MNTHKKLLQMGFRPCKPHKLNHNYHQLSEMVPDNIEINKTLLNGKWEYVSSNKVHPKWQKFYKLKFDETLTIWIKTIKNLILDIWIDGELINAENIYTHRDNVILNKMDIIKRLPTKVQRDFILNDIFK